MIFTDSVPQPDAAVSEQVSNLQRLFPPHPGAYSVIDRIEGTTKEAPQRRGAAEREAYAVHLSPTACSGIGGLGMYLGQPVQLEGLKEPVTVWVTSFVALDFDLDSVQKVNTALSDTLVGLNINAYLTIGTTGRGAHLFIFFDEPLRQATAYRFVMLLQKMAEDAGLGTPEVRPSSAAKLGSPIFLPYRGADKDGYGFNPLLDASDDLRPIALLDA